jgi:iron(III) transport system substrate-binding protein
VAAAKREGEVVVTGPNTADAQEAMVQPFEARYPEIRVRYTGLASNQVAPKLLGEREAGQYLWDVAINGGTALYPLIKTNGLDPLPPALAGPNGRDPSAWLNGAFDYADRAGQYVLVMSSIYAPTLTYSAAHVNIAEVTSWWDLLDPKWRGRMAMIDPRSSGAGQSMVTWLYVTEGFGKDYLRQLFAQNVTFSRDDRQVADWVARGQYLLQLSGSVFMVADMRSRGINIDMRGPDDLKEGGWIATGPSTVALPSRGPHPNAARVYLDFLLSSEGQYTFNHAVGYASRRQDVVADAVLPSLVPKPGMQYKPVGHEVYADIREEIVEFIRSLVGA